MKKPQYRCPNCKGTTFQLCIRQQLDVKFLANDDHEIIDGPKGDLEWDDDSFTICDDCGKSGSLFKFSTAKKKV